jgi:hypothetical protein
MIPRCLLAGHTAQNRTFRQSFAASSRRRAAARLRFAAASRGGGPARTAQGRGKEGKEDPMQSLRIATGMGGLVVVTTILLVAQFASGATTVLPF